MCNSCCKMYMVQFYREHILERIQRKLLGYNIDLLGFNQSVDYALERLTQGKSTQVVTINPEMIEMGNKNAEFAEVLRTADLVIPDGVGIKLGMRIHGLKIEQVPGIEFSKKIIEIAAEKGYSVGFLGAQEDVLQTAIQNLQNEYPNLKISFQKNGYFSETEESEIIEKILSTGTQILLVALGAPKQEIFIAKYKEQLSGKLMIGVGGSFDVWSGKVKRAPIFFRKLGCEWLYRLITQPSRFKRIFPTLPLFLFRVIIELNKD